MVLFNIRFYLYILWRWLLESVTEILVFFYSIPIGVIDSTYQHQVKASRYFVCELLLNYYSNQTFIRTF